MILEVQACQILTVTSSMTFSKYPLYTYLALLSQRLILFVRKLVGAIITPEKNEAD